MVEKAFCGDLVENYNADNLHRCVRTLYRRFGRAERWEITCNHEVKLLTKSRTSVGSSVCLLVCLSECLYVCLSACRSVWTLSVLTNTYTAVLMQWSVSAAALPTRLAADARFTPIAPRSFVTERIVSFACSFLFLSGDCGEQWATKKWSRSGGVKKEIFHFIVQLEEVAEIKNPWMWDVGARRRRPPRSDINACLLCLS